MVARYCVFYTLTVTIIFNASTKLTLIFFSTPSLSALRFGFSEKELKTRRCMTSASELFYSRRSRFGRDNHVSDLGFGSSQERNLHHGFSRRHHNHYRHDSEGCDPLRRSPHLRHASNRVPHSERESVRLNDAISHYVSGSSTNIDASIRGPRLTENDRLPGAVLLARERLLQRLRSVSLSEYRRNRTSSTVHRSRSMISNNNLRAVDVGDMSEISTRLSAGSTLLAEVTSRLAEVTSQLEHLQLLHQSKKKPRGLTQAALDSLRHEVFRECVEEGAQGASWDCSICLESFMDGDKLIRLPCEHRFHFACLDPWVRACGDCPYCRRGIVVASRRAITRGA